MTYTAERPLLVSVTEMQDYMRCRRDEDCRDRKHEDYPAQL